MHFHSKVRIIWASHTHRTSHIRVEFTWCGWSKWSPFARTPAESILHYWSTAVSMMLRSRLHSTESAAVSIHQRRGCLAGKHVPAWSPISDSQLDWDLGCSDVENPTKQNVASLDAAFFLQFHECEMQVRCTAVFCKSL